GEGLCAWAGAAMATAATIDSSVTRVFMEDTSWNDTDDGRASKVEAAQRSSDADLHGVAQGKHGGHRGHGEGELQPGRTVGAHADGDDQVVEANAGLGDLARAHAGVEGQEGHDMNARVDDGTLAQRARPDLERAV